MHHDLVRIRAALAALALPVLAANASSQTAADRAWFEKTTQARFDAVVAGDAAPWRAVLAPDGLLTDEDGVVQTTPQFLASLGPLAPGFAGGIRVDDLTVRSLGQGAAVHYWLDEWETVFGDSLHTKYVVTDSYRRAGRSWQLVASQTTVVPRDLEAIPGDTTGWGMIVGKYHMGSAAGPAFYVSRRDGALYAGNRPATATRLIRLSRRVFFEHGGTHVLIFVPDANGRIVEMREVHKYNEVVFTRAGAGMEQGEAPHEIELHPYAGTDLRTVTVAIGDSTRPFIFDTGAGFTVIAPDETGAAGCTPFGRVVGFRADGQQMAMPRCGPVRLGIGGYAARGEVGVLDLSPLLGKGAPPVGGLVGLASFGGQAITLDLAHDRVTVETPASLAARVRAMHPIHVRLVRGAGGDVVPFIEARADTGTLWLEMDSGNNGPVFLAPHALRQLGLSVEKGKRAEASLDVIGLGPVPATVAGRDMVYDGQLDPAFLRRIVVTIDLATGRAWAVRAGATPGG
ncbi:MAG: nuclear transport factor 2 family protein [Gemmatimonadota bacterium]|nr:nuclear transport factor 2 family protein [Gemmatimonadota bacterium]